MARTLVDVANAQHGAFTRAQALQSRTPEQVRARLANRQWLPVFHRVYRTHGAAPNARLRTVAAGLSLNQSVTAYLHTAAELHGFGVLDESATHVIAPATRRTRRPGLVVHSSALRPADVCRYTGVAATTAKRTVIDLARSVPAADGLAVLDAALHGRLVSPYSLREELRHHDERRGIVVARELVALADGKAESPMESRLRLRCIDAGLPRPELQIEVRAGRRCYRIDMGWREQRAGLEYDSLAYHGNPATLRYDRERHNWLTAQGWTMIYATARQVLSCPDELIMQINGALQAASPNLPTLG